MTGRQEPDVPTSAEPTPGTVLGVAPKREALCQSCGEAIREDTTDGYHVTGLWVHIDSDEEECSP